MRTQIPKLKAICTTSVTELDPHNPKTRGTISGFIRKFRHRGPEKRYAAYGSKLKGTLWFASEDAAILTLFGPEPSMNPLHKLPSRT